MKSVAAHLANPNAIKRITKNADIIMARNLEALALGVRARSHQRLIYECLDIHRTLTGTSAAHRTIQAVEARLLRKVDVVMVSSPAFLTNHFNALLTPDTKTLLVENKLYTSGPVTPPNVPPLGPPWTIGWFGMLRCERTFRTLANLALRCEGKVEILIAGKPSTSVFADFEARVSAAPHCRYLGAYTVDDLPQLYGACHFAWSVDWFEEGLNSSWLLPNRIYEASAFGAVPIALDSVETGRWLARHEVGVLIASDRVSGDMESLFETLTIERYAKLRDAIGAMPRSSVIADIDDCRQMLAVIAGQPV